MLALAHDLQDGLDRGEYRDRAGLAKTVGLSPARVSQLLKLTLLAPDIQEELLFLESVEGVEPIGEQALQPVLRHLEWTRQREGWARIVPSKKRSLTGNSEDRHDPGAGWGTP